ncbi:Uncharacterized protein FWK35_00024452 [Aphis craccivora]|uniref:THAP-type domain-containing protein n=1 Tax=Aphis craccivora TaxID=307492 RepID=A0A6G0VV07_APHCR|nr:Uncharacterized protein FWK35_00024452 [Aphis craccivora]
MLNTLSLKFAYKISNVKIAAQLLSSSTAKTLQYLKNNNYKQFSGCESNKIIPFIRNLFNLKFENKFLFKFNKKTFILGFAATVFQDHIELLFGCIRQRYGGNNNPNVIQFKTALKQILLKNSVTCSSHGNCNTFDDDATISIFSFKYNQNCNAHYFIMFCANL